MERNAPYQRKDRVSHLIREHLALLLLREVDFDGALATITEVIVTKKLDSAKVMVSVLPSDRSNEVLEKLQWRAPHLQRELLRKISIKPMPRITFVIDHGPEYAARIEKTLQKR